MPTKIMHLAGQDFKYGANGRWYGPDPYLVEALNDETKHIRRSLGPADGDPRARVFMDIVAHFGGAVLVDNEEPPEDLDDVEYGPAVTSETIDGPTPNGGVKSVAYYSNGQGNAVDKSKASHVEIVELDANGDHVHRTYGTLNRSENHD